MGILQYSSTIAVPNKIIVILLSRQDLFLLVDLNKRKIGASAA